LSLAGGRRAEITFGCAWEVLATLGAADDWSRRVGAIWNRVDGIATNF